MRDLIPDSELITGVKKCIANAESLVRDANILKGHKSNERAYTLFQLAIEEIGKASLVFHYATSSDNEKLSQLNNFKKEFLNHKAKTTKAIHLDYAFLSSIKGKAEKQEFFLSILQEYENLDSFNDLKNYSLYTSFIENKFVMPNEIITEHLLKGIEERAIARLQMMKSLLEFDLENFDRIKKASSEFDKRQVEAWANEFMSDFLNKE